jgi:formate hydrogenlyase subunit 3/multisubunit Na+/H+ antiporter MnhD subunit
LIKIGIYAIGRTIFTLAPVPPGGLAQMALLFIAALTMLLGGLQMVQQQSIKRLLAFSSVSQMGYIVMGLALGTPLGAAAAAMHMISHALLKSTLFLAAGTVTWRAGIHELGEGGGLARRMPFTCAAMCLAGLGLSGTPFLTSYVSKTMLEEGAFAAGLHPLGWIAIISSVLTFVGMARLIWGVFGRRPSAPLRFVREAPPVALLPGTVLLAIALLIGIFPNRTVANAVWSAAESLTGRDEYISAVLEPDAPATPSAVHREQLPGSFDWHHWPIPAGVMVIGSLLAYLSFKPAFMVAQPWLQPARLIGNLTRRWHSGLVMDYVMWNAFGTAMSAFIVLLNINE